jgi:hypothetical protein
MSAPSSDTPKYRLKVTAGPLKGARFPLAETVTIGRSSQVEIFLADAGVSRRHAKVFPLPDGGHVLIDLGSANGTRIDGESISEHRLELGQSFTVGSTTFEYEIAVATQPVAPDRGVYAVTGARGSAVDRTVVTIPSEDPAARAEARSKRPTAPELPVANADPAPRTRSDAPQDGWKRVEAVSPEGVPYAGDLISDVILYRNLRLRFVRGDSMPPMVRTSFEALEDRLGSPAIERLDPDRKREFSRYAVSFPAQLRFHRGEDQGLPVEVCDFGVGGARVRCGDGVLLDLDELTWLAIDLVGQSGARTIVFTARVVWMQGGDMGLVFSGAPGWARHSGTTEAEDTLVLDRDQVPAARAQAQAQGQAQPRAVKLRLAGSDPDG